jgi:hypothetical protein
MRTSSSRVDVAVMVGDALPTELACRHRRAIGEVSAQIAVNQYLPDGIGETGGVVGVDQKEGISRVIEDGQICGDDRSFYGEDEAQGCTLRLLGLAIGEDDRIDTSQYGGCGPIR